MDAQNVPMTMQRELTAGVQFLRSIINQSRKLQSADVDHFEEKLTRLLCKKYTGHWFPEHPMRERDYRCMSSDRHEEDGLIVEACRLSKLQYKDLALPRVFTLWIDPCEVSCRRLPVSSGAGLLSGSPRHKPGGMRERSQREMYLELARFSLELLRRLAIRRSLACYTVYSPIHLA
ncbi:protein BTG3-like [Hyperolius riggenbachi]|uniref:protein BTG3-like n=1 Tax=Hyperolius riggenbachi TaxID=752182 RepID=UPI0035A286DC